ncbi:MAG: DUF4189 domain-containing protein [Hyphomicrobium sp.]|nr:DUF4189 domain-containing protein [Hyphomicrobium sp.]
MSKRFLPVARAALLTVASHVAGYAPASAEGALAVGLPLGSPDNGFVYGYEVNNKTRQGAKDTAMAYCQGKDAVDNAIPENASKPQKACAVIEVFQGRCVAIAMNGSQTRASTGVGWAIANTKDIAKQFAIDNCKSMAGKNMPDECWVQNVACDTMDK